MQRVNVFDFCELGGYLWLLEAIVPKSKIGQNAVNIIRAQSSLGRLLDDALIPVKISRNNIAKLIEVLDRHVPVDTDKWDFTHQFTEGEISEIKTYVSQVKTVLNAEYATTDTYFVEPKGIYSTTDLIERAENALPPEVLSVIGDEAKVDFNQAER